MVTFPDHPTREERLEARTRKKEEEDEEEKKKKEVDKEKMSDSETDTDSEGDEDEKIETMCAAYRLTNNKCNLFPYTVGTNCKRFCSACNQAMHLSCNVSESSDEMMCCHCKEFNDAVDYICKWTPSQKIADQYSVGSRTYSFIEAVEGKAEVGRRIRLVSQRLPD